ncbi:MAG: transglycosylase SLT domain-containing protein [Cocleimonas sp.]|nr:transglycosylase SLT domain-containing protein [Cocleimonas sp.]
MNKKQPLAVAISVIVSLAGATGCSTTGPNQKQVAAGTNSYQKHARQTTKKVARRANKVQRFVRKAPQPVSDQQVFNEIYADAVKLGFDKKAMGTYYKRKNTAKQRQNALKNRQRIARNNWNNRNKRQRNRYKARPKQHVASSRRYTMRPNKPRYRRPQVVRKQPQSRPRYTTRARPQTQVARYQQRAPRYQRRVVSQQKKRWVRPAVHRPQVRPQQHRPRYQPKTQTQRYGGGNMWNRIKGGFRLGSELHNPTVQRVLRKYTSNPARLNRIFSRSTEYMHFVLYELKRRGMPTELALLPMVESAYKNKAVSRSGAAGMWQFMPATGRDFGLHRSRGFDARMDIFASTRAALKYLQKINREFKGDWYLTLAAYNVGQNRIHRERAKNRAKGLKTDYWSLSLPKETREYVPRLLAYKEILLNSQRYGVRLPVISNSAIMAQTNVNKAVNLRQVARMAGLPALTLVKLNPNFKNGVTNPRLSRKVVLPRQHAGRLKHAIRSAPTVKVAAYRPKRTTKRYRVKRGRIVRHHVRRGDTLNKIAARYGTTIGKIMRLNSMRSTRLTTGRNLKIAARSAKWRRG